MIRRLIIDGNGPRVEYDGKRMMACTLMEIVNRVLEHPERIEIAHLRYLEVVCRECGHQQPPPRDPFCSACDADLRPLRYLEPGE